ncbi:hypothetical protein BY996DRAFT_7978359 [Phakopsora pachyrhizi]|nr:hypothetical protein BY996DRAFT_7978359 [Phakopsora pachyrhizi]
MVALRLEWENIESDSEKLKSWISMTQIDRARLGISDGSLGLSELNVLGSIRAWVDSVSFQTYLTLCKLSESYPIWRDAGFGTCRSILHWLNPNPTSNLNQTNNQKSFKPEYNSNHPQQSIPARQISYLNQLPSPYHSYYQQCSPYSMRYDNQPTANYYHQSFQMNPIDYQIYLRQIEARKNLNGLVNMIRSQTNCKISNSTVIRAKQKGGGGGKENLSKKSKDSRNDKTNKKMDLKKEIFEYFLKRDEVDRLRYRESGSSVEQQKGLKSNNLDKVKSSDRRIFKIDEEKLISFLKSNYITDRNYDKKINENYQNIHGSDRNKSNDNSYSNKTNDNLNLYESKNVNYDGQKSLGRESGGRLVDDNFTEFKSEVKFQDVKDKSSNLVPINGTTHKDENYLRNDNSYRRNVLNETVRGAKLQKEFFDKTDSIKGIMDDSYKIRVINHLRSKSLDTGNLSNHENSSFGFRNEKIKNDQKDFKSSENDESSRSLIRERFEKDYKNEEIENVGGRIDNSSKRLIIRSDNYKSQSENLNSKDFKIKEENEKIKDQKTLEDFEVVVKVKENDKIFKKIGKSLRDYDDDKILKELRDEVSKIFSKDQRFNKNIKINDYIYRDDYRSKDKRQINVNDYDLDIYSSNGKKIIKDSSSQKFKIFNNDLICDSKSFEDDDEVLNFFNLNSDEMMINLKIENLMNGCSFDRDEIISKLIKG